MDHCADSQPAGKVFEKNLKIRRKASTAFVIISVIALVILAGYLIGIRVTEQVIKFIEDVPLLWESAQEDFEEIGSRLSGRSNICRRMCRSQSAGLQTMYRNIWGTL